MRVHASQVLLVILLVVLGLIIVSRYRGVAGPTVAELTEIALHGPTAKERTIAAVKLADYGPEALAALRKVLSESEQSDVRSACLSGLANLWDYESMEYFFELMESGSPQVRGRAAQVVMRMTGRQRRYSANDSELERRRLVDYMREDWEEIASASKEDRQELVRRLKESHESQ